MSVIFRILNKLALITSIIIDVSVDGARIKLFTGYKTKVVDWDFKKGFVKTYPGKSTNVLISRRLKETELTIYEYLDQNKTPRSETQKTSMQQYNKRLSSASQD